MTTVISWWRHSLLETVALFNVFELKCFAGDRVCFLGRNVTKSWKDRQDDRHFSKYNCSISLLI